MEIGIPLTIGIVSVIVLFVSISLKKHKVLSRFLFTSYPMIASVFCATLYFSLDINLLSNGYVSIAGLFLLGLATLGFFIGLSGFWCGWIWDNTE